MSSTGSPTLPKRVDLGAVTAGGFVRDGAPGVETADVPPRATVRRAVGA